MKKHTFLKTIDDSTVYEALAVSVWTKKELAKAYSDANLQIDQLEKQNSDLLEALKLARDVFIRNLSISTGAINKNEIDQINKAIAQSS